MLTIDGSFGEGGGSFTTTRLLRHASTNIEVIRKFLDVEIATAPLDNRACSVEVKSKSGESAGIII